MAKNRPRVPIKLLIIIAVILALGLLAGPFIRSQFTEEQLVDNVILNAIPFLLIFISIILGFIALIVVVSSVLSKMISPRSYHFIEKILIGGIVLGVVGMFQSWVFIAYRYGFLLLLFSTLTFIMWSHITPKGEIVQQEVGPVPIRESLEERVEGGPGA
jgi:hypothetical protein